MRFVAWSAVWSPGNEKELADERRREIDLARVAQPRCDRVIGRSDVNARLAGVVLRIN